MRVQVQLKATSQPIDHQAKNTYTKDGFFCVYTETERVYKYPVVDIWRVVEDYGSHA